MVKPKNNLYLWYQKIIKMKKVTLTEAVAILEKNQQVFFDINGTMYFVNWINVNNLTLSYTYNNGQSASMVDFKRSDCFYTQWEVIQLGKKEFNTNVSFQFLKSEFRNITVNLTLPTGVALTTRIAYRDDKKEKDVYHSYKIKEAYIEALLSTSVRPDALTDALLFIERKGQWLLENIMLKIEGTY